MELFVNFIRLLIEAPYLLWLLIKDGPESGEHAVVWWFGFIEVSLVVAFEIYLVYLILTRKKRIAKKNERTAQLLEKARKDRAEYKDELLKNPDIEPSYKAVNPISDNASTDWMSMQKKEEHRNAGFGKE